MAEITAKDVASLREKTGAGMMDCKKALTEANGDMEKAIELLRKKGAAIAAKRADREAKEGTILSRVSADHKNAILVEVNCETDFVARNDSFGAFAVQVANWALEMKPKSVADLLDSKAPFAEGRSVADFATEFSGKTGEKIEVRRVTHVTAGNGFVIDYIHPGARLGVLVVVETTETTNPKVIELAKDVAMQVAASSPLVLTRDKVNTAKIEQELDIYRTQARNEKKPEAVIDRIATGKLEKFYEDTVLLEQKFVKDPAKTITTVIAEVAKEIGKPVAVTHFERFLLGENN
ncbi:MAG: translation elongation factor Ts [Bacteroidetes bacterium]|nr:translation elongation factor Ts [Bacteroidota bacterium]